MGCLTLRRNAEGWRRIWYGQFEQAGKLRVVKLDVPFKGIPPPSLKETGDPAFEASRAAAKQKLKAIEEEARQKGNVTHLVERMITMKTGRTVEHVKLEELADRWEERARDRELSPKRKALCRVIFGRLQSFMAASRTGSVYLYELQARDAVEWRKELRKKKFSPATVREHLVLLRGACAAFLPSGCENPFSEVAKMGLGDDEMVHRQPLNIAEIEKLKAVALGDKLLYPLIVTVLATGMRRGDACRLKWADVDFVHNEIRVKTSKTGAVVQLPIMAEFSRVLRSAWAAADKRAEFVFPEAARMIEDNPDGLTWRFKSLAVKALSEPIRGALESVAQATLEEVGVFLDAQPKSRKADDTRKAIELYFEGKGMTTIAREMEVGKSTVSGWFSWVSKGLGKSVLRAIGPAVKNGLALTRSARKSGGVRQASIIDWHALRTSFVTMALDAGIPLEKVKKITGHKTDAIVCRHYFRPSADGMRSEFAKMPRALTGATDDADIASPQPDQELRRLAGQVAAGMATPEDLAQLHKLTARKRM